MIEHLRTKCKALGSIPTNIEKKKSVHVLAGGGIFLLNFPFKYKLFNHAKESHNVIEYFIYKIILKVCLLFSVK